MKNNNFLKALFAEPRRERYGLDKEISEIVDKDLTWISHHEDSKNLTSDYKTVKKDIKKSMIAYTSQANG